MSQNPTIFVTGSSGFVGTALLDVLIGAGVNVKLGLRDVSVSSLGSEVVKLDLSENISVDLKNVDVLVHLAGVAHNPKASEESYDLINHKATLLLAKTAADQGVKRFVFLSSIGVNGNNNLKPFTENDSPKPHDLYTISKYEAEQGLWVLAKETGIEVVIIRPPLVYGPNAPGNFGSLVKWMGKPLPLPFGAVHNQRSLVALDNLVNFISLCSDREKSQKAANQIFLISDGENISTTQLLRKVGQALNLRPHSGINASLVPVPVSIVMLFAQLLGKRAMATRLCGSLQVDSSKARDLLGWSPVVTMDEQLVKVAKNAYKVGM